MERQTLDSWKEIAAYLKRSVKTCRRLEHELGLPIHRLEDTPKARVFAYKDEIDLWIEKTQHSEKKFFYRKSSLKKFLIPALVVIVAIAIIAVVFWQFIPQEQVVSVFSDKKRRHKAAQTEFRIGRYYENLGETDKAVGAYRRVIRNYDDQIEVVAEALARLVELGHHIRPNMVVREVWVTLSL